jgi:2-dehydro-3-deoxyphosphogluconate aldolase/(4S)-4-hydroxy-2-oxoglutarate aldolase
MSAIADIADRLRAAKLVAILRGTGREAALKTVAALARGGVCLVELPLDQADAGRSREVLAAISALRKEYGDSLAVGAGTVLSVEQAEMAVEAGAQYIVSPDSNPDVIRRTKALGALSIPGAMTPTEIVAAHRAGADFVKLFPAGVLGLEYFRALRAPLPHIPLIAVGAVDAANALDYIGAGAVAVGSGGKLVDRKAVADGDWPKIEAAAREFVCRLASYPGK